MGREFLSVEDFNGDIAIGQKGGAEIGAALRACIAEYVPDFLRRVFTAPVAAAFTQGWDAGDTDVADLWGRLRPAAARYVWVQYTLGRQSYSTGVGEVWLMGENSERADYAPKVARNWNRMADLLWEACDDIRAYIKGHKGEDNGHRCAVGLYAPTTYYNRIWWGHDCAFCGLGEYENTII